MSTSRVSGLKAIKAFKRILQQARISEFEFFKYYK